jgi:VCBS repeat protein
MAAHKIVQVMVGLSVLVLCSLWLANTVWAQGKVSFIAKRDFLVGDFRVSLAAGDFNGDGLPDLAAANADSDTVSILLGRGDGTFATALDFGVGERPLSVAIGDFNGDGRLDLAVVGNLVTILLGQGDGTFQAVPEVATGTGAIAVGDFNGDGHLDLAVTPSILLGRGDGTFAALGFEVVGVEVVLQSITVGGFNGDGLPDVVTANAFSNTVSILLNNTPVVVVNDFVTFDPIRSSFAFTPDPTGCPAGFVGTLGFEARLTNASQRSLSNLIVAVTRITHTTRIEQDTV